MDWEKYAEDIALESSGGFLHLGKQRSWNVQRALADTDFDVGFREAMKVASAGDQEAELLSQAEVFSSLSRGMCTIVDLYTVEPVGFELSNQINQRLLRDFDPCRMSQDGKSSSCLDPANGFGRAREFPRNVGRFTLSKKAIKGFFSRSDDVFVH